MGRYNFNQRTRDGYEISPEQAAKWLERNDNNRNVNVAKLTPPTIEIVGFLGGAARFIAKP